MNIEKDKTLVLDVLKQQLINSRIANHFSIIPKEELKNEFIFFVNEEKEEFFSSTIDELKLIFDKKITLIPVNAFVIRKALSTYYRENINTSKVITYGKSFLEELIFDAKDIGASDIHIEVYEEDVRVRLRIDGHLIEKNHIEKENYLELINQIKIKSNLDITEKRLPQDGRIEFDEFDIRVSILPTHHGEKVVMRILSRDASHLSIKNLGFDKEELSIYSDSVKKPNGIVLISGPTGSGKTTTLYATLKSLNNPSRNIVTVEDPIEYTLKGINQVQLKEDIGLSFATALRSFLRQDPDIIMLGEIRDKETAQMAIRASLTGHLVLSTIHTNSAIGTISRLIDMGVPSFLLAETLNISIAQRLIRVLCNSCKKEEDFKEEFLPLSYKLNENIKTHFTAKGCDDCHYTGYKGRKAVFELLPIDFDTAILIKNNTLEQSSNKKEKSLSDKAFALFAKGETTLDEIYSLLINS